MLNLSRLLCKSIDHQVPTCPLSYTNAYPHIHNPHTSTQPLFFAATHYALKLLHTLQSASLLLTCITFTHRLSHIHMSYSFPLSHSGLQSFMPMTPFALWKHRSPLINHSYALHSSLLFRSTYLGPGKV